ncbi:YidB family protein [Methylobacterium sp. NEAU 140]|uniref:YidB family protein n=1 Tax=Methylobacterium sp. NEAU 140 TaxID=3064945 RepID=UPI002732B475|nr:YidB family protein [Methylobacterium sp. NEAU 140]MDP4023897.1 YidB family protein [Methylobacterium sp. NEAU 140]
MSKGYPSMTALLGLLAVAGYQNRDKIADWLGGSGKDRHPSPVPQVPSSAGGTGSGMPANLERLLGGAGAAGIGGLIASGLGEIVEHFTKGGHGETAKSWIDHGPNRDMPAADLERAIGPETLAALEERTGLSRSELLTRLSRELPGAVDRYSPDGRVPALG